MDGKTLYIFIDESGDMTFSNKGSDYFILTAVSTLNPLKGRESILGARYELLKDGKNIEYFHATEDAQVVRDKFYLNARGLSDYEIDTVVAEKRKANLTLYKDITASTGGTNGLGLKFKIIKMEEKFYKQICETLLQYVVCRYTKYRSHLGINKIVVVLDQVLPNQKREFVTKAIKTYIKDNFGLVPYMYFHSTKSDINSQIADYCCWAIKKKWADKELRPYDEIKKNIKSEFDIFKKGTTTFY